MGKVRTTFIKDACERLLQIYPDDVTKDFEMNKVFVMDRTDITSKLIRNKVAGYLVTLKKKQGKIIIPPKMDRKPVRKKNKKGKKGKNNRTKKWR